MNFRTTGILFGIVLAFSLVLLGMSIWQGEGTSSELLLDNLVNAGVKAPDVETLTMERADGAKFVLVRSAGAWTFAEPADMKGVKADVGQVNRVVEELFKARPISFPDLTSSKANHGLEPPGLKVTVKANKDGKEQTATVNVGDVLTGRNAVAIVTTAARPDRPIAVPRENVDPLLKDMRNGGNAKELAKWVNDYRTRQAFGVNTQTSAEEVVGLTLIGRGDDLTLNRVAEGWKMTAHYSVKTKVGDKENVERRNLPPSAADPPVDADPQGDFSAGPNSFNGVRPLIQTITNLQAVSADDFLPDDPAKLVEYGLADTSPERVEVTLRVKGAGGAERTEKGWIGKKVPMPATPGQTTPPGMTPNQVYVKVQGTPGVFRATSSNVDGIFGVLADPNPLRDRNLLPPDLMISPQRVVAIDLTKDGRTTRLRQPASTTGPSFGQKFQLWGEEGDPQDANVAAISKILDLITQRRTIKEFPAPNDANFTPTPPGTPPANEVKVVELRLWTELEPPPPPPPAQPGMAPPPAPVVEPKPKGNPIILTFGRVVRDGTGKVTEVYVRRTLPSGAKADFVLPGEIAASPTMAQPPFGGPIPPAPTGPGTDVLATVSKSRLDLLDPTLKSFSPGSAAKLTITQVGKEGLEANLNPNVPFGSPGKWTFARFPANQPTAPPIVRDIPADEGEVLTLLSTLSSLSAGPFDVERPSEADRGARGVSVANTQMKVTVTMQTPPPQPNQPPPTAETRIYYFGHKTTKDGKPYVYAMQEGRNAIFLVDESIFNRLSGADLRDRVIFRFDVARATRVKVFGWHETNPQGPIPFVQFEKTPAGSWVYTMLPPPPPGLSSHFYNGIYPVYSPAMTIDPTRVDTFLRILSNLRADKLGLPTQSYAFDPRDRGLGVEITLEGGQTISLNIGAGLMLEPDGNWRKEPNGTIALVPVDQANRFAVWVNGVADPTINPTAIDAGAIRDFKRNYQAFASR
jgi:hypothetical protein